MIHAHELFGRDAYSPREKKMLKAARLGARDLFRKRFNPELKNHWQVAPENVTLSMCEHVMVLSIHQELAEQEKKEQPIAPRTRRKPVYTLR